MKHGAMLAEFGDLHELIAAIGAMRDRGYRRLEAYAPVQSDELLEALALRRSRLPKVCFLVGMLGAGGGYFLQWLTAASLYPLDVGGRPYHFPLAFVPITFEMGVLFAAFAAFFGVIVLGRLLRLWHPVFEIKGFESATNDGYWLQIDGRDVERDDTRDLLEGAGAVRVVFTAGLGTRLDPEGHA